MTHRTCIQLILLSALTCLTACSSKTDASAANFTAGMNTYFEKNGRQCIRLPEFPVDSAEDYISAPELPRRQLAALVAAGLLDAEKRGVAVRLWSGMTRDVPGIRYTFSAAAAPFLTKVQIPLYGSKTVTKDELCFATAKLDKIVNWDAPSQSDPTIGVRYTYSLSQVAEWAKRPDIQEVFPTVSKAFDDAKVVHQHVFRLTNEGWIARDANSLL